MEKDTLRMQFLSGVITEGQYKIKLQENMDSNMGKEELIKKIKNLGDFGFTGDKIEFKGLLITASTQEDEGGPYYFVYGEDDDSEDGIFNSTNPEKVAEFIFNLEKSSLNESMIGGIVGIGAINQIPSRAKADYETAFEHFLGEKYGLNEVEIEEVKIEEGAFNDLLNKMESNTRMAADILTVITLAKEDKEGNAEKAVELLMKNHDLSEEEALEAVTRIFKKAFEWVDSAEEVKIEELEEGKEEVVLSNEILNFLEERGIIDPSDAQKVHTDLTAFLNKLSKNPTPDRIRSKSDYIAGIEENEDQPTTNMNPRDIITVDVPLFIRLLEYAREDAQTDMDLHDLTENIISLSASGKTLSMEDYSTIIGSQEDINERRMLQVRAGIIR
jgi:hypothetical protein